MALIDRHKGGNGAGLTSSNGADGNSIASDKRSNNGGVSSSVGGSGGNGVWRKRL